MTQVRLGPNVDPDAGGCARRSRVFLTGGIDMAAPTLEIDASYPNRVEFHEQFTVIISNGDNPDRLACFRKKSTGGRLTTAHAAAF